MKTKDLLFLLLVLVGASSCKKWTSIDTSQIKNIKATITDVEGKPIADVHEGTILKISAEEFRAITKSDKQLLLKEGRIFFDQIEAKIFKAEDDYVLTLVPILNYYDLRLLNVEFRFQNTLYELCRRCLWYGPKITGTPLAGITDGVTNGTFNLPAEMTLDAVGNLYVIDQKLDRHDIVYLVTPSGATSVYAGGGGEFGRLVGIGIDVSRNLLYVADATSQQVKAVNMLAPSSAATVLAGSGMEGNTDGPGAAASFKFGTNSVAEEQARNEKGQGLTVNAEGTIYVGERYGTCPGCSQIRSITPAGVVSTVLGSRIETTTSGDPIRLPTGITVNASNELFYTAGGEGNFHGVVKVTGSVLTDLAGRFDREGIADGTGPTAQFSYPKAITHNSGYYYVADGSNGSLRRVSSTGVVVTLAGVGHRMTPMYEGLGLPRPPVLTTFYYMPRITILPNAQLLAARTIKMDQVSGVAAQSTNLIYVSDYGYKCIWKITAE